MAHLDHRPASAAGYTPPKDRPTPRRNARAVDARRTAWRSRLEWIAIAVVLGGVVVLLLFLGRDGSSGTVAPSAATVDTQRWQRQVTWALTARVAVEAWVERGGWLVEILLPRTDAGVAAQLAAVGLLGGLLLWITRRRPDVRFAVAPALVLLLLLFGVRALH